MAVGDRLLEHRLAGVPREQVVRAEWLRGDLPPGPLGQTVVDPLADEVDALVTQTEGLRAGGPVVLDATVTLPDGTRVAGTVPGAYGDRLVRVVYSKLGAKHRLRAWAQLLLVVAAHEGRDWSAATVGRGSGATGPPCPCWSSPSPADAAARLAELVAVYRAGLESPLPLAPKTSGVYAEKRHGGSPVAASTAEGRGRVAAQLPGPGDRRVRRPRAPAGLGRPSAGRAAGRPRTPRPGLGRGGHAVRTARPDRLGAAALARADRDGMSDVFDLTGELPTGTTVLEASAGTGKTHTIAALAARYVAEGVARIDELMLVTFGRAATVELRERVRERLVGTAAALADPEAARASADEVERHLATGPADVVDVRRERLAHAVANFDAATIATTHGFCHQMLAGLGVAADVDGDLTFTETASEVVAEVAGDLYLRAYARPGSAPPPISYAQALSVANAAVGDRQARLEPVAADPDTEADVRRRLADRGAHRGRAAQAQPPGDGLRRPARPPARRPGGPEHRRRRPLAGAQPLPRSCWSTSSRTPTRCSGRSSRARSTATARWC